MGKITRKYKQWVNAIKFLLNPIVTYKKSAAFRLQARYLRYMGRLPILDNTILYESYHGKSMTCNPYAIFKSLINDPEYNGYKHIWALNDQSTPYAEEYKSHPNVKFVKVHSKEYLRGIAQSKYLINNVTFAPYFQKRDGQIYVNTWHGTPIKTLGKDMKGPVAQHANITRNFLHTDYFVHPNKYTADVMVASHDLDGIYNGEIIDEGYPRVDLALNPTKDIRDVLGIDPAKRVVLYAPTWRGEVQKVTNIAEELIDKVRQISNNMPKDYVLLLKAHTLLHKYFSVDDKSQINFVPDWIDSNELLSVVDVLVTDYSSIFFDFLVTKKPIIFYVYDKDVYEQERGLYLDLEDMPGPLVYTTTEVTEKISNLEDVRQAYIDKIDQYSAKYCYHDDGGASNRLKDIIFNRRNTPNVYRVDDNKLNVLLYCGGLLNNGITSSAINLLNNIDYSKYNVVLIDKDKYDAASEQNIRKINSNVKKLFRLGSMNVSIPELYSHMYLHRRGLMKSKSIIPRDLYRRELKRLVGHTNFDIAIDFSGYVPFWDLLFSSGDFKKRVIYQHNDMAAEYSKRVDGKLKHKKNLDVIFPLYEEFDKVISVAEYTRDSNLKNLERYISAEKAVYVHNCIDPNKIFDCLNVKSDFFYNGREYLLTKCITEDASLEIKGIGLPDKSFINFVNMGRLSPEKDQKKLIRAFSKITSLHPNVRLYIIGEGVLEKELKRLVATLGLQDKVIFTGQMSNPFVLLDKCDCFVLSSNHEGQPMVLLESLVLGLPIVATDIPGSRSILERGYGELVENSEAGLIMGMEKFILNQIPRQKFDYEKYNRDALDMFYGEVGIIE